MIEHINNEDNPLKLFSKKPSLYLELVMKSHPWIMLVRQMCMIINCERLVLDTFVIKCATSFFLDLKLII